MLAGAAMATLQGILRAVRCEPRVEAYPTVCLKRALSRLIPLFFQIYLGISISCTSNVRVSIFRMFLQASLRVSLFPHWSPKVSHVHRRYIQVYLIIVAEGILRGLPLLLKVSFKVSCKVSQVSFEVSLSAHCALRTAHCALRTAHCALRTAHRALRLNDVGVEVWSKFRPNVDSPVSKFGRSFVLYINEIHSKFDNMSTKLRHQTSTKLRPNSDQTSTKLRPNFDQTSTLGVSKFGRNFDQTSTPHRSK